MSNPELTSVRVRPAAPTAVLKSWPPRDEPLPTWAALGFELVASLLAAHMTGHWATGAISLLLLLAATWQLWMPVTFELNPKGVIRSVLIWKRRISWSEFLRYEPQARGVFLRHYSDQRMPFGAVSGLFLPNKPPHTELTALLDYYIRNRGGESIGTTQTAVP